MGKQMNIGDMRDHLKAWELADIMANNAKLPKDTFNSAYLDILKIGMIDSEHEARRLTWLITADQTFLLDKDDDTYINTYETITSRARRTKVYEIEYNIDCQEEWQITRLSNKLTSIY